MFACRARSVTAAKSLLKDSCVRFAPMSIIGFSERVIENTKFSNAVRLSCAADLANAINHYKQILTLLMLQVIVFVLSIIL